ncbi:MAG: hypothetical protein LBG92_00030, partial [Prevotellaceae bacterium]|nr:hypothetical protein [Prevotellaceae bacterium]
KLFEEIHLNDFYIISKKLEWVIGQNHHDVLFGFGGIKKLLEIKIKENNIKKIMGYATTTHNRNAM